jgi:hypothetical protein
MSTRPCARDGCDEPVFAWASPFCSRTCATGKPPAHWEKVAAARASKPPDAMPVSDLEKSKRRTRHGWTRRSVGPTRTNRPNTTPRTSSPQ